MRVLVADSFDSSGLDALAKAGCTVTYRPQAKDQALVNEVAAAAPDVLITPHMAGGTTAMLPRMAALARAQIERLLAGRPPAHVVAGSADG